MDIIMKKSVLALATLGLLAVGCSNDNDGLDEVDALSSKITFTTQKAIGETITLNIDAKPSHKGSIWIDLNGNGIREKGEKVGEFDEDVKYEVQVQTISVYGFVEDFECDGNFIVDLDVSRCLSLEELDCSNNLLTELKLNNNARLTDLDCSHNDLTALDLSKNVHLDDLDLQYNKLKVLDLTSNIVLEELEANNNELTAIDLSENLQLKSLDLAFNKLNSIDLSRNPKLETLNLSANQFKALNLALNSQLKRVSVYANFIDEVEMTKLIESMPSRLIIHNALFMPVRKSNEYNVFTPVHKAMALAKNWKVVEL